MKTPFRFVLVAVLFGVVTACTLGSIAYNNAVPLLSWYVEDYFDLQDDQREFVRERLATLHAWHRKSELPEYQRFLEAAARRSEAPVTGEDIQRLYAQGRGFSDRIGEYVLGDASDLLLKLDLEQIGAFEAKLEKSNEKFAREHLNQSPEKRLENRNKRYLERIEDWFGTLEGGQKNHVETALRGIAITDARRLAERKRLQAELLARLKSKPTREEMMAQLRLTLLPDQARSADYRAELMQWQRDVSELVAWLVTNATPQQRRHLQNKLRGYSRDILALLQ